MPFVITSKRKAYPLLTYILIGAAAVLLVVLAVSSYHVAPTDAVLVVTGLGRRRFITGGSTFIIPFLQRIDRLSLGAIQSELVTQELIPTKDAILIRVKAVANFQIGTSDELKEIAARNYLNAKRDAMMADVTEVLVGKMRETIGGMELVDLMRDRAKFNQTVFDVSESDMNNLGLELVTFNVQDFADTEGVIKAMGAEQSVSIQKAAQLARIQAEQEVAERDNELALKKAALKKESDRAKAEADLVYQTETATRTKELKVAEQDAQIAAAERQAVLAEKNAAVREQELNATVRKQADADLYAAQQAAEADLFTRTKASEALKVQAAAEGEATKVRGRADGEAIQAKGEGEAAGIKAQGEAYNAMSNPYILAQEYIKALPEIMRAVSEPLSKVDRITMYGEGNETKLVGDTSKAASQLSDALSDAVGIDLKSLMGSLVAGSAAGIAARPKNGPDSLSAVAQG